MLRPDGSPWSFHMGDDYAVVMLADENTENASFRVENPERGVNLRIGTIAAAAPQMLTSIEELQALLAEIIIPPELVVKAAGVMDRAGTLLATIADAIRESERIDEDND